MEKLQVIALALEIFGFGLAIIDTFSQRLSETIDSSIHLLNEKLGTWDFFFTIEAVDYAEDITSKEADNIEFRRIFFSLSISVLFGY